MVLVAQSGGWLCLGGVAQSKVAMVGQIRYQNTSAES